MRVVSDSGPLIALARVEETKLLSGVYGDIIIPAAVRDEVIKPARKRSGTVSIAEAEWFTWHAPFDVDAGGPDRNVELHYTTAILNIAFELTGDLSYAAYADHLLNNKFLDIVEQYRSGEMMGFQDLSLNFTIPHLENVVAKAMDQDPERFEEVKQEWQETRPGPSEEYEEWSRPDQASERSIGQLSTNPP